MIRIITDSVASIPCDMTEGTDLDVVSLYVIRDGVEHVEVEMDVEAFYTEIHDMIDNLPTTSQPSMQVFEDVIERAARRGDEVLGVFASTHLSGTYESALRGARAVKARIADFKYTMIDSSSCGFDEAWPVFAAIEAKLEGKNLKECIAAVLKSIQSTRFLFTPETLSFLQKGGRIGNAAALLGNLIKLAPVLTVTRGKADTFEKVRTRKRALERIAKHFLEDVEKHGLKNVVVHYIGDKKPALDWARSVIEPAIGCAVRVLPVSPVIGIHVGPAVGIAYECEYMINDKVEKNIQALALV